MTARSLFFLCMCVFVLHVTDRFFFTLHADIDITHLDVCVFVFLQNRRPCSLCCSWRVYLFVYVRVGVCGAIFTNFSNEKLLRCSTDFLFCFVFFATDNLFFKVMYICLYFKTALCSTDEMKFQSKWKVILHSICALLRLVFTRLVLKWLWPAGVYKASFACEHHGIYWKGVAIGKKLVPERRGRRKEKGQVGRGEDDGKTKT